MTHEDNHRGATVEFLIQPRELRALATTTREFLKGAELGSPRLLAVADNAALMSAKAMTGEVLNETTHALEQGDSLNPTDISDLAKYASSESSVSETIRTRRLTIKGYKRAYDFIDTQSEATVEALNHSSKIDNAEDSIERCDEVSKKTVSHLLEQIIETTIPND